MNVSVQTNLRASDFINNTGNGGRFDYTATSFTQAGGSCTGDSAILNTWTNFTASATDYHVVNWSSGCGSETTNVSIRVVLPSDVNTHNRRSVLTFTSILGEGS